MVLTSIGNDFCQQAKIASERLVQILGGRGKVAIMQGVPTAPNHRIRYECHKGGFSRSGGVNRLVALASFCPSQPLERPGRYASEFYAAAAGLARSSS